MQRSSSQVDILMPVYNAGGYIRAAIESILAQNYGDWRLLIQDDGSTDDSLAIAQQYADGDKRISYCRLLPPTRGRGRRVTLFWLRLPGIL